ncbi:MAG: glycosyltransferase [Cyclobacteriaceae bacterium]|nr:glycosyltransferase [Cyclobacteriaceae bacterium]
MHSPKYSVIVPVFNRPQEVDELLLSLTQQTFRNFEVIVVEDGSTVRCDSVVDCYRDQLSIQYYFKPNSGPGPSRNAGFALAKGEYLVVFDSDCILPPTYFEVVEKGLAENSFDAWGGPDKAHENFTPVQRAMGYTMSSLLTTGGIRGGKKHVGWFQPRSFNMGISRKVFEATQGFAFDRFAEDIEFSIRMKKAGFHVGLIADAFVFHKRRTTLRQFYHQVFNFGKGRALVGRVHPEEVKITHWFPTIFTVGMVFIIVVLPLLGKELFSLGASAYILYFIAIGFHSLYINRNIQVALLSVPSAFLQLCGYGIGFLQESLKKHNP